MKLPWNKKYLEIAFHVIITLLAVFILGLIAAHITVVNKIVFIFMGKIVSLLGPLLVAVVFSYLIDPVVDFFQKKAEQFFPSKRMGPTEKFKNRKKGTAIAYIVFLFFIGGVIHVIINKIGAADIDALVLSFNNYIQGFSDLFVLLKVKLAEAGVLENVDGVLQGWINTVTMFIKNTALSLADSLTKAGGWAINLLLGITVAFYFLVEKQKILYYLKDGLYTFLSQKTAHKIECLAKDINTIFSGYIGGQITDAIIMTVLISAALSIGGIPYGVVIGVISGFSNLIPYVGAIVAFILSVSVALLSGTPAKALYAAVTIILLQQIDGMIIVPKVVGKSVELHPALVLLSLSVFGGMFGILGMIVAVPCTAIIKLLIQRKYTAKKRQNTI